MTRRAWVLSLIAIGSYAAVGTAGSVAIDRVGTRFAEGAGRHLGDLARTLADAIDDGVDARDRETALVAGMPAFRQAGDESEVRAAVKRLRGSSDQYLWVGYADASGVLRASEGEGYEGRQVGAEAWFRRGLRAPFVSDPRAEGATDAGSERRGVVDLAFPVVDEAGRTRGVLCSRVTWGGAIDEGLRARARDEGVELLVVRDDGHEIVSPSGTRAPVRSELDAALVRGAATGYAPVRFPDGAGYLTGVAASERRRENGAPRWVALARQPLDAILAPARAARNGFLALFAAAGAVLMALWRRGRRATTNDKIAAAVDGTGPASGVVASRRTSPLSVGRWRVSEARAGRSSEATRDPGRAPADDGTTMSQLLESRTSELDEARKALTVTWRARYEAHDELARVRAAADAKYRELADQVQQYVVAALGAIDEAAADVTLAPRLGRVRGVVETAGVFADEARDASEIEAGSFEASASCFDPALVAERAAARAYWLAAAKGVDLAYDPERAPSPFVEGDAARIERLVTRVLEVAVGHAPPGAALRFGASTRLEGAGPPTLCFEVRHVDSGAEAKVGGDLSMVRRRLARTERLAARLSGAVTVRVEGGAPVFELRSPVGAVERAGVRVATPAAAATQGLAGRCVIVVEPGAAGREVIACRLRACGVRALVTASPREALAWLQAGLAVDAMLVDPRLPGVREATFAEDARASRPAGSLPIVSLGAAPAGSVSFEAELARPIGGPGLESTLAGVLEARPLRRRGDDARAPRPDAPRRSLSVLLVDDNPLNQKVARLVLERLGHTTHVASGGEEAVAAVRDGAYDLVLMDVHMPDVDGLEATRRIRTEHGEGGPLIVAMTAGSSFGGREVCLEAGMDDYLTKPLVVAELMQVIGRATPAEGRAASGAFLRARAALRRQPREGEDEARISPRQGPLSG